MINKSLANTTISVAGYYAPNFNLTSYGPLGFASGIATYDRYFDGGTPNLVKIGASNDDIWSLWVAIESNVAGWNVGLQAAYVDGDTKTNAAVYRISDGAYQFDTPQYDVDMKATYAVAARAGSTWGDFDAMFTAAYINDGTYSLKTAGTGLGTSAFWGDSLAAFGGDILFDDQYIFRVDAGYKLSFGKIYAGLAYDEVGNDSPYDNIWGGRIGYKFTVAGVNAKVEYRYVDKSANSWADEIGYGDIKQQRVRVDAYYKF